MCLHKGWSGFRDFWEKGGGGWGSDFSHKNSGGKNLKKGGRQYRESSKNRRFSTPLPTIWRDFKNFPSPIIKLPPPHFWLPPFLVKIFHPPIRTIFEKSYPPLWRRRGRGIRTMLNICTPNQMTGFNMKCNTRLKWVKSRLHCEDW